MIALDERHLRRLVGDYVKYHHDDRIHDSLDKDTPNRRGQWSISHRRMRR